MGGLSQRRIADAWNRVFLPERVFNFFKRTFCESIFFIINYTI